MRRTKRRPDSWYTEGILASAPPGGILDPKPKKTYCSDPLCCCRTAEKGRAGGQDPRVRWKPDGSGLYAYCLSCGKTLRSGYHKQRRATHVLGLCKLPLEHLDLADAVDAELMLPEHLERPNQG